MRGRSILELLVNKLIVANLGHRPLRTLLSVIAIGVEVTMILTLVGVSNGTLDATARRARGVGADVLVRPPGSSLISLSTAPMSEKLVSVLAERPGVAIVTGTVVQPLSGFDSLTGVDFPAINKMASAWRKPGDPEPPNPRAGGFKFIEGGPMVGDDDIIVDEYYARQKKLHPGDHITLANHEWRISGVFESGKLARIITKASVLQEITGNPGKLSQIYLKLKNPDDADAFATSLKSFMNPGDPSHGYQIFSMEELTSQLTVSNVGMLKDFIYVVIGVASIVGFIVVFMAMYTAVLERTREIGILKAVGAGSGYIVRILFRETMLLAILGTILGILMTYGTQWLMAHAVPASLVQETVYGWWGIAGGIAIAGAVVGTIIPAMKAVNQDITEALSYE